MEYNMQGTENMDFTGMELQPFLLGLLSIFENKYQACADPFFGEITWKQFFAIICINLCKESPTINELSEVMRSSHQNVKQILLKLEKVGYVTMVRDEKDKRKQRITVTQKCRDFCAEHDEMSKKIISSIFTGVSQEDLLITIRTIMTMEENLGDL